MPNYPFKRYDLVPPTSGMEERADGYWVKLEDTLKLLAENANLKAEIRELRQELRDVDGQKMSTLDSDGVQQTL